MAKNDLPLEDSKKVQSAIMQALSENLESLMRIANDFNVSGDGVVDYYLLLFNRLREISTFNGYKCEEES